MNRTVYIPVEVKSRAFTAKLLLATALIDKGFDVVIGAHGDVRDLALNDKDGVYIEKDFFYLRSESMKRMKENGFLLYAYDEEGIVYPQKQLYIDTRSHYETFQLCDRVFTWGEEQHELLRDAYTNMSNKFFQVGNPRVDLITNLSIQKIYSKETDKIRKIGSYILINSNFTAVDNPQKAAEEDVRINVLHGKEDRTSQYYNVFLKFYEYEQRVFISLCEAIDYLSNKLDTKIVIRAHPAEDLNKWNRFNNRKNIIVTSKFDVVPWIINSQAVIHNTCTTGIEAYLLGKPVISYFPTKPDVELEFLPDDISFQVKNKEELQRSIERFVYQKEKRMDTSAILKKHILLNGTKGNAIQHISEMIYSDCLDKNKELKKIQYKEDYILNLLDPALYIRDVCFRKGIKKFSYETKKMITQKLRTLCSVSIASNIKVKHIGRNTFLLTSNN